MRTFIFTLLVLFLLLISFPANCDRIICDYDEDVELIDPETQCWVQEDKSVDANLPKEGDTVVVICEYDQYDNYDCKEI